MTGSRPYFYLLFTAILLLFGVIYHELLSGDKIYVHDAIIWFGSFHYYVICLLNGNFPYWTPDLLSGTYFFPNMPFLGLLEPTVLLVVAIKYLTNISTITGYIYFYLFRLLLYGVGCYLLYARITRNRIGALLAASALVFTIAPQYFRQPGALYSGYLTPLGIYFLICFFENIGTRKRYFYLASAVLVYGITMNVYVPAYDLFNTVCFVVLLFVLGIVNFRGTLKAFSDKRLLITFAAGMLLLIMMMAPSLVVYFKDSSGKGELFPVQRIALKSQNLKKIMATEVGTRSLSDKFLNGMGCFNSYGNIADIFYPDLYEAIPFFAEKGTLSETGGYFGIILLIFAIIGFIYSKSRYRYLALIMLVLIHINMFSFKGMSDGFNPMQHFFNAVFPPLKMIDIRETFSPIFQIYLGMLSAMGLAIFFSPGAYSDLLRNKWRTILGICLAVIIIKIGITGIYAKKFLVASNHDIFTMSQIVIFVATLYFFGRGKTANALIYGVILLLVLADLYAFSRYAYKYALTDSAYLYQAEREGNENRKLGFQYFRDPLPGPQNMAWRESIVSIKGALSLGVNHSPFNTKRYYDFLTHIPLDNQLALDGVVYPVVRFYPLDRVVRLPSSLNVLNLLAQTSGPRLSETLFLENTDASTSDQISKELMSLSQYEDVPWLTPSNPAIFYGTLISSMNRYAGLVVANRSALNNYLHTPSYSMQVISFKPNEVIIAIDNMEDGYLYYNDGWSRYWHAFDGTREIPVEIANYNFKAVYVGKGSHLVRFVFDPKHYKAALVLFYLSLIFTAGALLVFAMRPGKENRINTVGPQ